MICSNIININLKYQGGLQVNILQKNAVNPFGVV